MPASAEGSSLSIAVYRLFSHKIAIDNACFMMTFRVYTYLLLDIFLYFLRRHGKSYFSEITAVTFFSRLAPSPWASRHAIIYLLLLQQAPLEPDVTFRFPF